MSRVVEVLQAIARHEANQHPYCELGVVTSNFDDDDGSDSHSVSVKLKDSGLAINRIPLASTISGMAALPRQGDVVLVLMPRGDLSSAIAIGQVYSDERRPPTFTRDEAALVWPGDVEDPEKEAVDIRVFSDGSKRSFTVALGGDKDALMSVSDGSIDLTAGGVQLKISHSSDSDGTVDVTAGGTKISVAQDGDLSIEAAGTLKLKAPTIKIEGDTEVKINGQTVDIN
jgi:phage baseplate assembly protein gpV